MAPLHVQTLWSILNNVPVLSLPNMYGGDGPLHKRAVPRRETRALCTKVKSCTGHARHTHDSTDPHYFAAIGLRVSWFDFVIQR